MSALGKQGRRESERVWLGSPGSSRCPPKSCRPAPRECCATWQTRCTLNRDQALETDSDSVYKHKHKKNKQTNEQTNNKHTKHTNNTANTQKPSPHNSKQTNKQTKQQQAKHTNETKRTKSPLVCAHVSAFY